MAVETRQDEGLSPSSTREHLRGVGRAEGVDAGRDIELTYYP
jgi:hypothetical protein